MQAHEAHTQVRNLVAGPGSVRPCNSQQTCSWKRASWRVQLLTGSLIDAAAPLVLQIWRQRRCPKVAYMVMSIHEVLVALMCCV